MVNARTYPLWRDLAMSEDLPKEALKTVIEALCAPAKCPAGFDARGDQWREEALKAALPALLARMSAKRLRGQLLVHGDEKLLAALAAEGTVTADDVPAILRHRRLWAGLVSALARRPEQVEAAVALLPRLADHEVERVVGDWDSDRYTRKEGAASPPPVPQPLFDAVLEASLTPLAAYLLHLVDQGCLTLHRFLSRADRPDHPDRLVFDLDPPGDDFAAVRAAAVQLHQLLDELRLPSAVMTTGSRGLHVVVPLDRRAPFDETRALAHDLTDLLASRHPDTLTTAPRKQARRGRLYLDVQCNAYAQTVVAPYAVRARPEASEPVGWLIMRDA